MGRWKGLAERRYLAAALLFLAVVLTRLPFATMYLWAWDSVFYARALEQGFHVDADPGGSRPHPPGYIWYVAAAQLLRVAVADSNAAYVLLSILASAAGAALLWLVASRWMRPGTALVLALGYAFSPLVWTYSEIAYPYTVLALISLAIGALLIDGRVPLLASLLLGVLSGARQDVLFLLAPLWIWSISAIGPRRMAVAPLLTAVGVLSWWIPSAALSGGPDTYLEALLQQAKSVVSTYSAPVNGPAALAYNLTFALEALAWSLGVFGLPLVLGVARAGIRPWTGRWVPHDRVQTGLLLWTLPGILVFTFIHIGEWGHVLSIVPPLFLWSGLLLDRARSIRSRPRWLAPSAAAVVLTAAMFLSGDAAYAAVPGPAEFSTATLARHDARLRERIRYVRRNFLASGTVLLAREDYQLVRYYLPEYRAWYWDPDPHQTRSAKRKRAMRPTTVVVFTAGLRPLVSGDVRLIEIAPGVDLTTLALEQGSVLELQGERYVVREPPGR